MKLRLTHQQRLRLFRRERVHISGEGTPPVEAGQTVRLSSQVALIVHRVDRKQERWSLHYTLVDSRDPVRKLKRTPHAPLIDASEPTKYAIRDAAEQSAYTSAPTSLSDAGEAIDRLTQERYSKEAHMTDRQAFVARRLQRESMPLVVRLQGQIREAEAMGLDVSRDLARLNAGLAKLERRIKQAKHQRRAA